MQIKEGGDRLSIKIGYYPMLDAVLAIRQIFSVERFKPYCHTLEIIDSKLLEEEREEINTIAQVTKDWLLVIEKMIDLTMEGVSSTEEMLIKASNNPKYIFGEQGKDSMVTLVSNIWYNYCFVEMSKQMRSIGEKSMEISKMQSKEELIDYILGITDRVEINEHKTIKFNIKPELSVKLEDIENIIVMPSIFSSRNVAFWYSQNTFLFYIALDSKKMTFDEPTDNLMLRTLAFNDKTRLKMLKSLARTALSVNDIAEKMEVNASTASRHIKVFKDAAFVDIQSQEGNSIYYSINEKEIARAMKSIYDYIFGRG